MKTFIFRSSSHLVLALAFLAPAAQAQDDAAAQGGNNVIRLEEIIVTSQRMTENLQKAAVAVSVVTGSAIRDSFWP